MSAKDFRVHLWLRVDGVFKQDSVLGLEENPPTLRASRTYEGV